MFKNVKKRRTSECRGHFSRAELRQVKFICLAPGWNSQCRSQGPALLPELLPQKHPCHGRLGLAVVGARAPAIRCAVSEACELAASVLREGLQDSAGPQGQAAPRRGGGDGGAARRGRVSFIWSLPAPFPQESSVAREASIHRMPGLQKPTPRSWEPPSRDSRFHCCPGLCHSPAFVRSSPRAPHVAAGQASHGPAGRRQAKPSAQGRAQSLPRHRLPSPGEGQVQVISGFPSSPVADLGPCTALLSTCLLRATLRLERIHGGSLAFSRLQPSGPHPGLQCRP